MVNDRKLETTGATESRKPIGFRKPLELGYHWNRKSMELGKQRKSETNGTRKPLDFGNHWDRIRKPPETGNHWSLETNRTWIPLETDREIWRPARQKLESAVT